MGKIGYRQVVQRFYTEMPTAPQPENLLRDNSPLHQN
jgi:hypothetical protein